MAAYPQSRDPMGVDSVTELDAVFVSGVEISTGGPPVDLIADDDKPV
jgi:hypothetical protein